ncbi:MAG: ABC transporter ATP-binding protein [Actinomycetota bacterium]
MPAHPPVAGAPAVAVHDLGLTIGGAQILAGVTLEVPAGELLGVIGPNGAGKTTLFNLLSGLLTPSRGTVHLGGRDVTRDPPHRRARAGLGRTFQTSSVFPALSVLENVRLAAQAALGGSLSLWRRPRPGDAATRVARDRLAEVGLAGRAASLAGALAHGEKRQLEIALLLAADPAVILLDEPLAGVSAADVPTLTDLIGRVHREYGRTVLMVEHHLEVVLDLVDRVAVLHHGQLLACDRPHLVVANPEVQAAYLGQPV